MIGKGNKYALAALKHKRAAVAGEVAKLETTLEWKRRQLVHLDATLAIFGEGDPDSIKAVKPYKRVPLFRQGELSQLVRKVLREAGKPLLLSEVVSGVVKELGHDEAAIPAMRHRVRASLQYLWRERKQIARAGSGSRVLWGLCGSDNQALRLEDVVGAATGEGVA
jgi:hypothetical protein